jgi:hypothetical protein
VPTGDAVRSIARALRIIAAHPGVAAVGKETVSENGGWWVDIDVRVGLPSAWMAEGHSPNGVRAVEPITLIFPARFPLRAPTIWLRADFDRSLAHVQPGDPDSRPEPCIVDGRLSELLHQQGLAGILNQLVLWLDNAALGRLIDQKQGWEPVRRDDVAGFVVADAPALRALVSRNAGSATFRFDFLASADSDGGRSVYGKIALAKVAVNPDTLGSILTTSRASSAELRLGESLAIVAWPGRQPSGEFVVADSYQPETVINFGALMERAIAYGCDRPLNDAINWLKRCAANYTLSTSYPLAIILCARRPFNLIGSNSPIELCPYVMDIGPGAFMASGDQTLIQPIGHRHAITEDLLRTLSGAGDREGPRWALVGCGSLGSKIALHLGRAGRGPATVIDPAYLSPHNAARHALVPDVSGLPLNWVTSKAAAVARAMEGLGQASTAVTRDVVSIVRNPTSAKKHLPKKTWAVVNTTALLGVREALGSVPSEIELPRVLEASLFGQGKLGLLTVEGPSRNPNTLDLMAEAYACIRPDDDLRPIMFGSGEGLVRQTIGEGCGSPTMVMSDARVSMFAAPMAEAILRMQDTSLPAQAGRLLIGRLAPDGLGLSWMDHTVPPVTVVGIEGPDTWSVRISRRAADAIAADVRRWPGVEAGGIVMGRISEAARTFYVTDVLPAPDDSVRSPHEFVLGTRGARRLVRTFAESAGYSLFCLGTWHSHLMASGPSGKDRRTADAVALARLAPSILLIHTPAGFTALLADAADARLPANEDR